MHRDGQVICKLSDMNPIWEALSEEQRKIATGQIEVLHFEKNDIIHREGDIPTHIMMLVSGKVKIYKEGIGQRQQILRLIKPYDLFSYRAIVAGDRYNAFASAIDTCVVYRLPKECFMDLLEHNSAFCLNIMQRIAQDLAQQEVLTVHLTQKHIRARLAEALLSLKQEYGTEADGSIAICLSREDIANMSNMTTSNAIRTLSQFVQEGLIRLCGRKIFILQDPELNKISRLG